jgi:hypothetical protein
MKGGDETVMNKFCFSEEKFFILQMKECFGTTPFGLVSLFYF